MRKLSKDEYYDRVKHLFNFKYKYTNDFTTTRENITCICPIHGKFTISAKRHLKGQGCSKCGKELARKIHKNDYNSFLSKATKKLGDSYSFPNLIEEYENKLSLLTIVCNKCGDTRKLSAAYILSEKFNVKCKKCENLISYSELCKMNKTKYAIIYFNGLKNIHNDKVERICNEHGQFESKISTIIKGQGKCKLCSGHSKKLTKDEVLQKVNKKYNGTVTHISEYTSSRKQMLFKCNVGHTFYRSLNTLLNGNLHHPCKVCAQKMLTEDKCKTQEEFKKEFYAIFRKEDYDLSESVYTKYNEPITVKCNICGEYVTKTASLFLNGFGCNKHGNRFISKIEQEIEKLLRDNGIEYIRQYRASWLNNKSLDFYLPKYSTAIECQGIQHFKSIDYYGGEEEFTKRKRRDCDKLKECNSNGIKLIYYANYEYNFPYDVFVDKDKLLYEILEHNLLGN